MSLNRVKHPGRPSIAPRVSQQMGVRVSDEVAQRLRQHAIEQRRPLWQIVDEAFLLYLAEEEKNAKADGTDDEDDQQKQAARPKRRGR